MALKTRPYDSAAYLKDAAAIAAYMSEALATNDPAFIRKAMGTIARARGMTEIAREAGLSRESLYKALGAGGNPEFGTVLRVLRACGLHLTAIPDEPPRRRRAKARRAAARAA
jgi:probable addiction module antidote protein